MQKNKEKKINYYWILTLSYIQKKKGLIIDKYVVCSKSYSGRITLDKNQDLYEVYNKITQNCQNESTKLQGQVIDDSNSSVIFYDLKRNDEK